MEEKSPIQVLGKMLEMAHRVYLDSRGEVAPGVGKTLDTHATIRRLMFLQEVNDLQDLHVLLDAAEMARHLDPDFSHDEAGSCVSLLRKTVQAIDRQHAEDQAAALPLIHRPCFADCFCERHVRYDPPALIRNFEAPSVWRKAILHTRRHYVTR